MIISFSSLPPTSEKFCNLHICTFSSPLAVYRQQPPRLPPANAEFTPSKPWVQITGSVLLIIFLR